MFLKHTALLALIAVTLNCTAAESEQDVLAAIDASADNSAKIARTLWEYAELGFLESKSSALLQKTLQAEGFTIESGVAAIPTAFTATYGSGKPVIAILAEYDALPGINQDATAQRSPIEGKNAGQACGHNLFAAGSPTERLSGN